ncbi:alpha/beta fold hydrolase [Flavilitoribacter nigricans]|uniref:Alpha/beta hydrolase n=1 Tax=Flavilitoribacter nigricans (strain ATCC 23147 / DSM 23189 / NBRC 102662 / NCIMB 1420 / SS-2) TaxID=1122177 RepID=A0A2D0N060_FLAN2|nr:alpha/beta hydrolase [Flavilitoribacter nigricans]PHN01820.1 alpha/beta hydrolase [Flavilitoribacter nigricans DSM 23189 = NBRC 102662]
MWSKLFLVLSIILAFSNVHAQNNPGRNSQASNEGNKIVYGVNQEAGQYVQAGDAKIYYELYGSGQPIILLHGGLMGSIGEMAEFIENLKPNYQVIAMATRGHGKSEIGTAPITYELKANDVMEVVNAVTQDSVIILGFSDGAYTGYKVASMYPERVKKLIAIGAGEQKPGLRKVVPLTKETVNLESEFWRQKLALMPEPGRIEEFWLAMADFYNTMVAGKALFMSIKCPVLLMSGELDRNAPLPTVINAYNMIPNSQLSIIPNTGHVVFMENFEAVWASMVPFLKDGLK